MSKNSSGRTKQNHNVLVFVHGGAWGSGLPWMYRLVALGISKCINASTAILIEYPVFPDSFILDQADCVYRACKYIKANTMELGIEDGGEVCYYLMGHSSGANICALAALQAATNCHKLAHNLVGFNGVYDIAKHFLFEKERGVEEISPMQPAAKGASNWDKCSPSLLLDSTPAGFITAYWPKTLLVHGLKDTTVPDTSTRELARVLRYKGASVEGVYPTKGTHADCIFDMIFGSFLTSTTGSILIEKT